MSLLYKRGLPLRLAVRDLTEVKNNSFAEENSSHLFPVSNLFQLDLRGVRGSQFGSLDRTQMGALTLESTIIY